MPKLNPLPKPAVALQTSFDVHCLSLSGRLQDLQAYLHAQGWNFGWAGTPYVCHLVPLPLCVCFNLPRPAPFLDPLPPLSFSNPICGATVFGLLNSVHVLRTPLLCSTPRTCFALARHLPLLLTRIVRSCRSSTPYLWRRPIVCVLRAPRRHIVSFRICATFHSMSSCSSSFLRAPKRLPCAITKTLLIDTLAYICTSPRDVPSQTLPDSFLLSSVLVFHQCLVLHNSLLRIRLTASPCEWLGSLRIRADLTPSLSVSLPPTPRYLPA